MCLKIMCAQVLLCGLSQTCLLGIFGLKYSSSPEFAYAYSFEIICLLLKVGISSGGETSWRGGGLSASCWLGADACVARWPGCPSPLGGA